MAFQTAESQNEGFSQRFSLHAKGKNPLGKQTKIVTFETFLWSLSDEEIVSETMISFCAAGSELMKKSQVNVQQGPQRILIENQSISPRSTMKDSKGIFLLMPIS